MSAEVEKYAELLGVMPGGCVIVEDGVIQAANDEAVETTGIPLGRLLGIALADLLVPEFQAAWTSALAGAGDSTRSVAVRLARALTPLELSIRRLGPGLAAVAIRSMATDYHYSALAGAELTHDTVTGFPNRYHLLSQLHDRMMAPQKSPLALIGLWIDELPQLASAQGERVVDRVVWEVGQRLQTRLRSPDILGRFDDAGFLSLLTSDAPTSQLTDIADRLRDEVAFPVDFDNSLVSFTASVAVASITDRRPSIERALAQLDAAANRAATGAGNRTEVLEL
ncbi:MAG: diguanylate cyclase [Acidimicrobiia bacterium]|nr:diguanylate cyclase [Acidimicrobiia bacterium]